ncbi:MAG: ABC transporter permease [Candidatus Omnitrophica bacterium]|nr:ABC transporter permease [Candidatus Omnitrophota bacterium]
MLNLVLRTGSATNGIIRYVGQLTILFSQTVILSLTPSFKGARSLIQANRIGPGSCVISSLVAFFVGMIIALQMAYQMVQMSAEMLIPKIVSVALTRELAPVLTALIVAGRVGAGIAAEIGSMKVTEQVDALKAFAVNPVKYLVVPRFLGLILMLPVLAMLSDVIGIWGGYLICVYKLHISHEMFWKMVFSALAIKDIVTGLVKTFFFGAIIAIVGCHQGLNVRGGAEGVGKATTAAVVRSFILIIMTDCLITFIFYFLLNV